LIDIKENSRAIAQNLADYPQKPKGWFSYGAERFNVWFNGNIVIEQNAHFAATDVYIIMVNRPCLDILMSIIVLQI
jgi:hypothetical protein